MILLEENHCLADHVFLSRVWGPPQFDDGRLGVSLGCVESVGGLIKLDFRFPRANQTLCNLVTVPDSSRAKLVQFFTGLPEGHFDSQSSRGMRQTISKARKPESLDGFHYRTMPLGPIIARWCIGNCS